MGVGMLIDSNIMRDTVKLLVSSKTMSSAAGQAFWANVSTVTTSRVVVSIEGYTSNQKALKCCYILLLQLL